MKNRKKAEPWTGGWFLELAVIVAVALGLALGIQKFLVKPYRIPSPSMVPTLTVGQRVLVNRVANNFNDPSVGDIVVFHPPADFDTASWCAGRRDGAACSVVGPTRDDVNFIKRVVGVPGDRIEIRGGHVTRNGRRESDGYIRGCVDGGSCDFPRAVTIPKDTYFMMGDNRGESDDSRFWGPVPRSWIIGKAFATYFPIDRIGLL